MASISKTGIPLEQDMTSPKPTEGMVDQLLSEQSSIISIEIWSSSIIDFKDTEQEYDGEASPSASSSREYELFESSLGSTTQLYLFYFVPFYFTITSGTQVCYWLLKVLVRPIFSYFAFCLLIGKNIVLFFSNSERE